MALSPKDILLDGRVALVTGAANGIGKASALALARFGADLAICDRDAPALTATTRLLKAEGRRVESFLLDVRDDAALETMYADIRTKFGTLDILVNNAGGTFGAPFEAINPRGEQALIAENFTSVVHCTRGALPLMSDGGSIVNITSIEAHRAAPGVSIYAAMKAAVLNLSMTLALELAPRRIRVNCIAPDMIPTEGSQAIGDALGANIEKSWPDQPWLESGLTDDVAGAVIFLASDLARFVTGSTVHVDGGNMAAAGWKRRPDGTYIL